MRTNRHVPLFFSISVFAGLFFSPTQRLPAAPSPSAAAGLSAVSTGISATLPDPKRPGKLLYELRAVSANGQSDASGFHGEMDSVWARLYQSGVPAAILTAPHVRGGSAGKSVALTGTGGVVVKSLTEPGTKMTADTMVWHASADTIMATGHVYYHNGKTGATLRAPVMNADTRLKTINVYAGHGTARF